MLFLIYTWHSVTMTLLSIMLLSAEKKQQFSNEQPVKN